MIKSKIFTLINTCLLILFIFILFISISIPANAGAPKVEVTTSFPQDLNPGDSSQLDVKVSEISGGDWMKDVTVMITVSPSDGILLKRNIESVARIDKFSHAYFSFPINILENAPSGEKVIQITVQYYEMDLFNIDTYGPYYVTESASFSVNDQYGFISISSSPNSVSVYLDGAYKGIAPITLNKIPIGSHTIKLTKSGYNDVSKTVTVSSGKTSYISESLSEQTGTISLSSSPSGSSVYLDGKYKGTTPLTLNGITIGSHMVKLTKSGYNDVSKTVTVSSGKTSYISESLSEQTGTISLSSSPSGSSVYLDGKYKGTTPLTLNGIKIGSQTIKLTKSGYNDVSKTVTVSSGKTSYISESLSKQTGTISLSSSPSGSSVYLDGKYKGTTPLTLNGITIGSHMVQLTKSGYNDISKTVTVSSGKTNYISKNLSINPILPIGAFLVFLLFIGMIRNKKNKKGNISGTNEITSDLSISRETEFYQGFIRLKMSITNTSSYMINDVAIDFDFDDDLLRIEKHEPNDEQNGKIILGNIASKSSKTVAVYFDPMTCSKGTDISCLVTYKDTKGRLQTSQMKPKNISVVCPIMKTDSDINVGRLKEFVEKLPYSDSRMYQIPKYFVIETLKNISCEVLQKHDVKHIRTLRTKDSKTFEIWYYGKTKVNSQDIVIRITISSESQSIELFASTKTPESLVGLLAEVGRELKTEIESKTKDNVQQVNNIYIKDSIIQRSNLLNFCDINGNCTGDIVIEDSLVHRSNIGSGTDLKNNVVQKNDGNKDRCPFCGTEYIRGLNFCTICGKKI